MVWQKKFGQAQTILGPAEGQGISAAQAWFSDIKFSHTAGSDPILFDIYLLVR